MLNESHLEKKTDLLLIDTLINEAVSLLKNSYAPYSNIHVASIILTNKGNKYGGVNVENSSYGLTICAERSAIASMVSHGERKPEIVVIVTDYKEPIPPCGACRQVISEFNKDALIVMYSTRAKKKIIKKLSELFPQPFKLSQS